MKISSEAANAHNWHSTLTIFKIIVKIPTIFITSHDNFHLSTFAHACFFKGEMC